MTNNSIFYQNLNNDNKIENKKWNEIGGCAGTI